MTSRSRPWRRNSGRLSAGKVGRDDLIPLQFSEKAEDFARFEALFAGRTAAEWRQLLAGTDFCCEVVSSLDEVFEDPQVRARDLVIPPEAGGPAVRRLGHPLRIEGGAWPQALPGARRAHRRAAPGDRRFRGRDSRPRSLRRHPPGPLRRPRVDAFLTAAENDLRRRARDYFRSLPDSSDTEGRPNWEQIRRLLAGGAGSRRSLPPSGCPPRRGRRDHRGGRVVAIRAWPDGLLSRRPGPRTVGPVGDRLCAFARLAGTADHVLEAGARARPGARARSPAASWAAARPRKAWPG